MPIRYEITNGALPVTVYLKQGAIIIDSNIHAIYEEGEFDVYADDYTLEFVDSMGCVEDDAVSPDTVLPCDVFFVTGEDGSDDYKVYSYNPYSKESTYRFEHGFYSPDIAVTDTRMWIPNQDSSIIKEYIITLNPFSINYNRDLSIPSGLYWSLGLGVTYANDVENKYILVGFDFNTYNIRKITFDNSSIGIVETLFSISPRYVNGDIIYNSTTGNYTISSKDFYTSDSFLTLYTNIGDIIFEINTTGVADRIWGMFVFDNKIYAVDRIIPNSKIYEVTDGGLILFDTITGLNVQGSSQALNCGNYIPPSTTTTSTTTSP